VSYQPLWINGKQVSQGVRDTENRYLAIANYLAGQTEFTVLDFGAHIGYFSRRLAAEFGAACTAVDDHPRLEPTDGVQVINERLTAGGIRKLGKFDVVLCLSVLHHVPQWRAVFKALRDAGRIVFVETAHPDEHLPKARMHHSSADIHKTVEETGARILTWTRGYDKRFKRPLWVIDPELQI